MRYHSPFTKMTTVKKTNSNNYWPGCGEIGITYIAGGLVKWQNRFGKIGWHSHLMTPIISLLSVQTGEIESYVHAKMYTGMFIMVKKQKLSKCSLADELIKKM